jgi:hypothetical protein
MEYHKRSEHFAGRRSAMRKNDMNTIELMAEACGIIALLVYSGLQIYYGVSYGPDITSVVLNVAMMLLVYIGLSLLECYPERVNGLSPAACTGDIRKYTIRMVRISKLIFTGSLLLTSICDAMGHELDAAYSLIVVAAIIITAVCYEYKIIKLIRQRK